jgi:antitoxin CptB
MKELDLLLSHWLESAYPAASATDRLAFEHLLERQDPELAAWFLGRERPADPALASLVDAMLATHR